MPGEESILKNLRINPHKRTLGGYFLEALLSLEEEAYVTWGGESTLDLKVKTSGQELKEIAASLFKEGFFTEEQRVLLRRIQEDGLNFDTEIQIDDLDFIKAIYQKIEANGIVREKKQEIGGSPAVSAKMGYSMQGSFETAKTSYFGSYPLSVREHVVQNEPSLIELFDTGKRNEESPGTLSFEGKKFKLMLSQKKGRELGRLLNEQGKYEICFPAENNVLLAIGGLNKGSPLEYLRLANLAKQSACCSGIFVGTNSFKELLDHREYETVRNYFRVLQRADIISMNEAELDQMHEAFHGKQELTRSIKLEQLNLPGLVIVHSHAGARFCFGNDINFEYRGLIEECIQASADLSSFYYSEGILPSDYNELMHFRSNTPRNERDYLDIFSSSWHNLRTRGIAAPYVKQEQAKGSITGAGARFDGAICAMLAHVIKLIKKRE